MSPLAFVRGYAGRAPDHEQCQVIRCWRAGQEFPQVGQNPARYRLRRQAATAPQDHGQALHGVLLVRSVPGLGQSIGVKHKAIARAEAHAASRVLAAAEEPKRKSGRFDGRNSAISHQDGRTMAGIADLYLAGNVRVAADQGGVEGGQGAFAEDAISPLQEGTDRHSHREQTAEDGVQMGHEQRGCHSLAGHVAGQKEQAPGIGCDQVAIISADGARGFVVITSLPAAGGEGTAWQQGGLNSSGQLNILLESPLLLLREVAQAEAEQGVRDKPFRLNRFVAHFAQAVTAVVHALEGGIDLPKEALELGRCRMSGARGIHPVPPVQQLGSECERFRCGHDPFRRSSDIVAGSARRERVRKN